MTAKDDVGGGRWTYILNIKQNSVLLSADQFIDKTLLPVRLAILQLKIKYPLHVCPLHRRDSLGWMEQCLCPRLVLRWVTICRRVHHFGV